MPSSAQPPRVIKRRSELAAHSNQLSNLASKAESALGSDKNQDAVVEVLRLSACLMVVAYHFVWAFAPQCVFGMHSARLLDKSCLGDPHLMSSIPFNFLVAGNFAVSLFFILSGYVLPRAMFARKQVKINALCGDLLKRYVRLAIPLWAFTFVGYLCFKTHIYEVFACKAATMSGAKGFLTCVSGYNLADQTLALAMIFPFEHAARLVPPAWTLGIELIGSFLSYALAAVISTSSAGLLIGLVTVLLVPGYLKLFAIGTLFAFAEQRGLLNYSKLRATFGAGASLVAAVTATVCLYIDSFPCYAPVSEVNMFAAFYAPLVVVDQFLLNCQLAGGITVFSAVITFFAVKLWLTNNGIIGYLSRFGKHTYTIYLSHLIIIGSVCSWIFLQTLNAGATNYAVALGSSAIALIVFTLLVCALTTDLVDGNAIKLARRLKGGYLRSLSENLDKAIVD